MKVLLISDHKKNGEAAAPSVYIHLNQEVKQLAFSRHLEKSINDFK
jgi:hypothetical protein